RGPVFTRPRFASVPLLKEAILPLEKFLMTGVLARRSGTPFPRSFLRRGRAALKRRKPVWTNVRPVLSAAALSGSVEVEVFGRLLLQPEALVLGSLLEELRRLL